MDYDELLFLVTDRIQKIRQINEVYDLEKNAYIAFSGGKDSTVLHHLVDMALPGNKIPRVFSDTGIDFTDIRIFVKSLAEKDKRFYIIRPGKNITELLKNVGYPFKSKFHSHILDIYSRHGLTGCVYKYAMPEKNTPHSCPQKLQFQFLQPLPFKMSDKCCMYLKKKPFKDFERLFNRKIGMTGMRREEKGHREKLECLVFEGRGISRFHPLAPMSNEWIEAFIINYNVQLCRLYYPPFNFKRTGCKGCPYNIKLQEELDTLEKLLPNERKQCEMIWAPVYKEYRRLGYRLEKED